MNEILLLGPQILLLCKMRQLKSGRLLLNAAVRCPLGKSFRMALNAAAETAYLVLPNAPKIARTVLPVREEGRGYKRPDDLPQDIRAIVTPTPAPYSVRRKITRFEPTSANAVIAHECELERM